MVADKDLQFLKSPVTKKEAIELAIKFGGLGSSLKEQGFWDASLNIPNLTDEKGTIGHYYVVSKEGTVDFGNGDQIFSIGDWVYYNTFNQWVKFETGVNYIPVNRAGDTMTGNISFTYGNGIKPNIIVENSNNRILTLNDSYSYIRTTNSSPVNIIVPLKSSVNFDIGTTIEIIQAGTGQVTIVAEAGVTINTVSGYKLFGQHSASMIIKIASDEWDLIGNLIS